MGTITVTGTGTELTSALLSLLGADIVPGSQAGYEICKALWTLHPLGGKVVEKSVNLALGKKRKINIPCAFEDKLVKAFDDEWEALKATRYIRDLGHVSRAYGVGAIVYGSPKIPTDKPILGQDLYRTPDLYFNILDPLNTAGSMVTNQNPNAPDFQKQWTQITAAGQPYHQSRSVTLFNGTPVYLDYQSSAFSFSGRSVFLRALFPLKSFIQTMIVDDMVSAKAGLIIAKMKQGGSVVNRVAAAVSGFKRELINVGVTHNTLTIGTDESIESIDLQNTDKAMTVARDNIISNIAAATDTPAILLKDESFAKGLASGDQDMLAVVQHIDAVREELQPAHHFFDNIVQWRAWNPDFYATLQTEYPELKSKSYEAWFYEMQALFTTEWPTLLQEPESEKVKRNADMLKAMSDVIKTLLPQLDPDNKARAVEWFVSGLNDMKDVFPAEMEFDPGALASYTPLTIGMDGDSGEGDGDAA